MFLPTRSKGLFSRTINAIARNKWQRQREKKAAEIRRGRGSSCRFNEQRLPARLTRSTTLYSEISCTFFLRRASAAPTFMLGLIIYNPFSDRLRRDGKNGGGAYGANFKEQITSELRPNFRLLLESTSRFLNDENNVDVSYFYGYVITTLAIRQKG